MLQSAGLFVVEGFRFKSPLYLWTQWAKIIILTRFSRSFFLSFPHSFMFSTIIVLNIQNQAVALNQMS